MRKPWLLPFLVFFLIIIAPSCQKKSEDTSDAQPKVAKDQDALAPAIDAFAKYAEDMKKIDEEMKKREEEMMKQLAEAQEGEEDLGALLAELAQLEASKTLSEALERSGMEKFSLLIAGETTIDGHKQACWHIQQGTNHPEQFVTENHYAVCPGETIYRLDIINDKWESFSP